jgi:catechol 2,3-dioxygenase-like lactoylglutathione lyase family enzyme
MNFDIKHLVCRSSDIDQSREFYVNKLELEVLEEEEQFFAVRSGGVRMSFFGGSRKIDLPYKDIPGFSVIFSIENVNSAKEYILSKGIKLNSEILEAAGFMKYFSVNDPDENIIYFGEHLKNPLEK